MALRIAIGVFAALRAVLVYGEAGVLASRPLELPRLRRVRSRRRLAQTASLWDLRADATSPLHLGVR